MTDCARVLEALRRGPQTASALYGLHCIAHSRISDLRAKGHSITCERIPGEGARAYLYTLHEPAVSEPDQGQGTAEERADTAKTRVPGSLTAEPVQLALVTL